MSIAFFSFLWLFSKTWKLPKTPSQAILAGRYPPTKFVGYQAGAETGGCSKYCSKGVDSSQNLRGTLWVV